MHEETNGYAFRAFTYCRESYTFPSAAHGEENAGIEKPEVIRRVVLISLYCEKSENGVVTYNVGPRNVAKTASTWCRRHLGWQIIRRNSYDLTG